MSTPPEPTALYHVFGDADLLLYIGISDDFGQRWKQHARKQPWWNERRRQQVVWYPSREEALEAETEAIESEHPRYNQQHNVGAPPLRARQHRPAHAAPLDQGIAALMRDYRKREGLSQAAFAAKMAALGWAWHQATAFKAECAVRSLGYGEAVDFAGLLGTDLDGLIEKARAAA